MRLHDGPPTSRVELWAWYAYSATYAATASCINGWIPQQMLYLTSWNDCIQRGALPEDSATFNMTRCERNSIMPMRGTGSGGLPMMVALMEPMVESGGLAPDQLVLIWISVALVATMLFTMVFSPLGDYGTLRRRLLFAFNLSGGLSLLACACFRTAPGWLSVSIFQVTMQIGYWVGDTWVNSSLPILAAHQPRVLALPAGSKVREAAADAEAALLSARAKAISFVSACSGILVTLGLSLMVTDLATLYQLAAGIVGSLWCCLSVCGYLGSRDRPGPPLPSGVLCIGPKSIWIGVLSLRELPQTALFLTYICISADLLIGFVQTVALFVAELSWTASEVGALLFVPTVMSVFGALGSQAIASKYNISSRAVLVSTKALLVPLLVYALFGYAGGGFGLVAHAEIYIGIGYYGLTLGAWLSYIRVALIPLVPLDLQGSFFGIFSMIESIGQAIGPIIIGILARATGSLRSGFAFMLGEALICIVLLRLLKPAAGAAAATRLNRKQRMKGSSILFSAHQEGCPYCKRIHRKISLEQCEMVEAQISRESNMERETSEINNHHSEFKLEGADVTTSSSGVTRAALDVTVMSAD